MFFIKFHDSEASKAQAFSLGIPLLKQMQSGEEQQRAIDTT